MRAGAAFQRATSWHRRPPSLASGGNIEHQSTPPIRHFLWLVRRAGAFAVDLRRLRLRLYFQRLCQVAAARLRRLARFGLARFLAGRISLFRPRHRQRPARRPLRLAPAGGRRHDSDRPWPRRRRASRAVFEVYAAYGLGVGLGVGCAYVPAVGAVQRWFVRRRGFASGLAVSGIGVGTLVDAAAGRTPDRDCWAGAAPISCSASRRRRWWGTGAADRERSARPRPRSRWRSAPAGSATGRRQALRSRRDPSRRFISALRRLPDLLVRRVCAVRPSRALRRTTALPPASAVLLLGVIGVGSTAGRFFLGGLADRMGRGFPC